MLLCSNFISARSALFVSAFCLSVAGAKEVVISPHTFTIPDGYELELAAASGLVERPMHMYFDDEGALYVTDSSGDSRPAPLQLAEPSHRILRLVDKDGDGAVSSAEWENRPKRPSSGGGSGASGRPESGAR